MKAASEYQARQVPAPEQRIWIAAYVWSNQEKSIERQLRMRDIEVFLPVHTVTKRWKNRTTAKVELPLFPGYVFVKIPRNETVRVLEVSLVHSIVGNARGALELPHEEIEALRTGLQQRMVEPHPYLKIGNTARIRSGALAGMKGVVVRVNDQLRVVLSVDAISRSIAVHVTAEDLEFLEADQLESGVEGQALEA